MCLHKNLKHDRSRQLTNLNLQCGSHTYSVNSWGDKCQKISLKIVLDVVESAESCMYIHFEHETYLTI